MGLKNILLLRRQHFVGHLMATMVALVQHQRLLHPHGHPGPGLHLAAEGPNQIPDAAADISQSQKSNHRSFHAFLLAAANFFLGMLSCRHPAAPRAAAPPALDFMIPGSARKSGAAPSGSAAHPAYQWPCFPPRSSGPCRRWPQLWLPGPAPA